MGIPQFRSEAVDQADVGVIAVSFLGLTWQANDILEIVIGTDGWVPTLTAANGFALATDPAGNTASVTTNGGAGGASQCGMFVFWKRATGSTTGSDPPPVLSLIHL